MGPASSSSASGNNLTVNLALRFLPAYSGAETSTCWFTTGGFRLATERLVYGQLASNPSAGFGDAGFGQRQQPDVRSGLHRSEGRVFHLFRLCDHQGQRGGGLDLLCVFHARFQRRLPGQRRRQCVAVAGDARANRHRTEQPVRGQWGRFLVIHQRQQPDREPGTEFLPAYNGAKNIYMLAYDGQSSGWQQRAPGR